MLLESGDEAVCHRFRPLRTQKPSSNAQILVQYCMCILPTLLQVPLNEAVITNRADGQDGLWCDAVTGCKLRQADQVASLQEPNCFNDATPSGPNYARHHIPLPNPRPPSYQPITPPILTLSPTTTLRPPNPLPHPPNLPLQRPQPRPHTRQPNHRPIHRLPERSLRATQRRRDEDAEHAERVYGRCVEGFVGGIGRATTTRGRRRGRVCFRVFLLGTGGKAGCWGGSGLGRGKCSNTRELCSGLFILGHQTDHVSFAFY